MLQHVLTSEHHHQAALLFLAKITCVMSVVIILLRHHTCNFLGTKEFPGDDALMLKHAAVYYMYNYVIR